MALLFDGTNDWLQGTDIDLSGVDYSIHMWIKNSAAPGGATYTQPLGISDSDGSDGITFSWDHVSSSARQAWAHKDASGYQFVKATTSLQADTWYAIGVSFNSSTGDLKIWVDGSNEATTASVGAIVVTDDDFTIGSAGGGASKYDGDVAEVGVWSGVVLDSAEWQALADGYSPLLVRPGSLVAYVPLVRTVLDVLQGGMTTNGSPTVSDHPPVIYPAEPQIITAPAVNAETNIVAGVDALTLTTYAASINAVVEVLANVVNLTLTTYTATVNAETSITANTASLALAANAAVVNAETNIQAVVHALAVTGYAGAITLDANVAANTDILVLTEQAATVNAETSIAAGVDTLALTSYGASINEVVEVPARRMLMGVGH